MTSFIPAKSLPASIRATPDIWCHRREDDQKPGRTMMAYQLFPSAALQLWDHHLHTSGLLPRFFSDDTSVIYEHDWVLSYQSITCFPQEVLMELTVEDGSSAQTHVWVDRVGSATLYMSHMITIYDEVLATAVRVWTRWMPMEMESRMTTTIAKRALAPFTDEERQYFQTECVADQTILDFQLRLAERFPDEIYPGLGDDFQQQTHQNEEQVEQQVEQAFSDPELDDKEPSTIIDSVDMDPPTNQEEDGNNMMDFTKNDQTSLTSNVTSSTPSAMTPNSVMINPNNNTHNLLTTLNSHKRKMTLSNTLTLESFGTFLPQMHGMFLLAVRVGHQHLDFVSGGNGETASTTWLAEVAFQALIAAELVEPPSCVTASSSTNTNTNNTTSVVIQYRSFAKLGNELRCSLHGDRVFMLRSAIPDLGETEGNQIVVLVAKAQPL